MLDDTLTEPLSERLSRSELAARKRKLDELRVPGTAPADIGARNKRKNASPQKPLPNISTFSAFHSDFSDAPSPKWKKLSQSLQQNINVLRSDSKMAQTIVPQLQQVSDFLFDSIKMEAVNVRLRKELSLVRREKSIALRRLELSEKEVTNLKREVCDIQAFARSATAEVKRRTLDAVEERTKVDQLTYQTKMSREMSVQSNMTMSDSEAIPNKDPMRFRCFRLLTSNQNTISSLRLLRRQKNWLQARCKVLENQMARLIARGIGQGGAQILSEQEIEDATRKQTLLTEAKTKTKSSVVGEDKKPEPYQLMSLDEFEDTNLQTNVKEMAEDLLTTIIMNKGDPLAFLNCKVKVYSQHVRDTCIDILGREFYALYHRNTSLETLVKEIRRIFTQLTEGGVISNVVKAIQEVASCERATCWIVDSTRGFMWTKVGSSDSLKQMTVQMPLGKPGDKCEGIGLVNACYMTQEIINVHDAHTDTRFDKSVDYASGYRTKSVICFPLFAVNPNETNRTPKIILQAVN